MSTDTNETDNWVPITLPIPEHWEYVGFEDAFSVVSTNGLKIPEKQYANAGRFPIIDQGQKFIGGYTDADQSVINRDGTVIVFGDHTRCFKKIDFPFAPGADGTKVLQPSAALDPKFAFYGLLSVRLPDRGYSRHYSFLRRSKFPIAPKREQSRIVAKIEELFSELDKGVESLATAREQLQAYRQSVLAHAFEGRLSGSSQAERSGWPSRHLGELIDFLTSGSRGWADYYSDEGDLFIRAQNLKHDRLDLSDIAFVRLPEGRTEGVRTRVRKGDVLITITGANVTKTGLVDRDVGTAYVSQHVALCRPSEVLLPEYLHWYLLAEAGGRKQLNKAAYGAGKPGLNLENIKSVSIPLPTPTEQRSVVASIAVALGIAERLTHDISDAQDRVDGLRQSVLKCAFSGQLLAQDPADEPASILLERIRVERSEGGTKTRRNNKNGNKEAA